MSKSPTKVLVILGPTASGKSDLAVELAKKYEGEVISADSRQIYRHLDIGTGKITLEEMKGIPHHLIDIREPNEPYSVQEWVTDATAAIRDIAARGHLPIICGGTGFYISALVDGVTLPEVGRNDELRNQWARISTQDLFERLATADPERAANIGPENRRRIERALEITTTLGSTVPKLTKNPNPDFEFIQIGITTPDAELRERIHTRLVSRVAKGLINEARTLHSQGLTYDRMRALGLEYRYLADLLEGIIPDEKHFIDILSPKIWQYSRRQKAWFKRDTRIQWFPREEILTHHATLLQARG